MTVVAVAAPATHVPDPRPASAAERLRARPVEPRTDAARPLAALRLSGADLHAVADGLREAGFDVLDIRAHPVGPAPTVLVLELPPEEPARRRLLEASADGPSRILVGPRLDEVEAKGLRPGRDLFVQPPFHPLQVAAAALRAAEASPHELGAFAGRAFADLSVG